MNDAPRAVAVVGPTAAGKGALGLAIAQRLELPILVCDSVKVYRRLDIGSAKPSSEARAAVPHHLLDLVDPDQVFSAGDYARAAWDQWAQTRGVFVGGTGFYLRATAWTHSSTDAREVDRGVGDPAWPDFEARWLAAQAQEPGAAFRALAAIDPETASSIHPHNVTRLVRALWLCEAHGGPVSAVRRENPPRPRMRLMLVVLEPDPVDLELRIAGRLDAMLEAGWLAEVEALCRDGYDESHKAMRSLGYRQLLDVVRGRVDLRAAREAVFVATRQYARRQRTYFRHQLPAEDVVHLTDPAHCPWDRVEAFVRGASSAGEETP